MPSKVSSNKKRRVDSEEEDDGEEDYKVEREEDDEESEAEDSEQEVKLGGKSGSKKTDGNKTKTKPRSSESSKKSKPNTSDSEGPAKIMKSAEGDSYINLAPLRRLTVRSFKGKTLIDLREFYEDKKNGGELKPGSKGLSLTPEQWETLKNNINAVDKMVANLE